MVVGGYAVIFHGHMRTTIDVDVIWLRTPAAEAALQAALKEVNAAWISSEIDPATRLEKLVPVEMGYIQSTHLMMLVTDRASLTCLTMSLAFRTRTCGSSSTRASLRATSGLFRCRG